MDKISELEFLVQMNVGNVILGQTDSGKSSIAKGLFQQNDDKNVHHLEFSRMYFLNVYGNAVQNAPKTAKSGIVSEIIQNAISSFTSRQKSTWLLFDGCLQSGWTEMLHPLLESSRMLLVTGECIHTKNCLKILIETISVSQESPSFFTHVGILRVSKLNTGGYLEELSYSMDYK